MISAILFSGCSNLGTSKEETSAVSTDTVSAYICPMNCENSGSAEPGKCKMCGMNLEKNPNKK
jgi:hypothetical protein